MRCVIQYLTDLRSSTDPLFSKDRERDMPFVIGGGPCTYNPEPLADLIYSILAKVKQAMMLY